VVIELIYMKKRDRLTKWEKMCLVITEMMKHFAPVRKKVMEAVRSSPKKVTLKQALEQIKLFNKKN